ncbi:MAG TPA: D-alanine--D-alanine ligase [Verrucomicrobiae bacterium]|nr:D-alanine--D-alanine ligase [Verrucomicrobiae bacterium]
MRNRVRDPRQFGRVAVLMGGWSAERQVSLWSGEAVLSALRKRNVDAHGVDATRHNVMTLARDGYERAFIVLHGGAGEDGTVQAALELQGLPYTGSGVTGSAVKMNKVTAKRIWLAEKLPTAPFLELDSEADAKAAAKKFKFPLVIKPAAEGSSVGVTIVKKPAQVAGAFKLARAEGRAVMAEKFVKGAEMTVAVLDGVALPSIRIVPAGEFYDYHAKYIADDTQYHCPSGVTAALEKKLRALAVEAFRLVGASGWGRVDFIVEKTGKPWLLELNTVPGMTSHSLVPMAAKAAGMSFDELCWAVLETSMGARDAR